MLIQKVIGQYPDEIHQRYLIQTGTTHAQLVGAYTAIKAQALSAVKVMVVGIILIALLWSHGWVMRISGITATIGFTIAVLCKKKLSDNDIKRISDYVNIGVVLQWLVEVGINRREIRKLMTEYRLTSADNGTLDAREMVALSSGINMLLTKYAFRTMAHEESDKRQAEYWRKRFAQTFRVAIMLRLIPEWYTVYQEPQSPKTHRDLWRRYFDPRVTGQGHVPTMDWGSVQKTTPDTSDGN